MLVHTRPASASVVPATPREIALRFSEPVQTGLGSVRVYDAAGERVAIGKLARPAADTITVRPRRSLATGTYTVGWRIVSDDSHPVHGAFVFSVGAPSAHVAAPGALDGPKTSSAVSLADGVLRFADFGLVLLVAGGSAILVFAGAPLTATARRRLFSVLAAAAAILAPVALVRIVYHGAVEAGLGLAEASTRQVVSAVLATPFGKTMVLQAVLTAAAAAGAVLAGRSDRSELRIGLLLPTAALAVTPSISGHAGVAGAATLSADAVHLAAAAVWTGGLAFVLIALAAADRDARWPLAARLVPAFSTLAVGSVAILVVAGLVNAYLELETFASLWTTGYGRLLLVKLALIAPLLALGAYNNRRIVPRLRRQVASAAERVRFARAAAAELALVGGVVAVTAMLVAQPPAKAELRESGSYAATGHAGPFKLDVAVDPATAGANELDIRLLSSTGDPAPADEARLLATLPAKRLGPLRLEGRSVGRGHFVVRSAELAIAGDWQLEVEIRRGELQEWTTTLPLRVARDS